MSPSRLLLRHTSDEPNQLDVTRKILMKSQVPKSAILLPETTDASKVTTDAGQGMSLMRRMVSINLALVARQALSAGFYLSGYNRAVTVHAAVAPALQFGALIQAITAIVLRRRRRVPPWVAGFSVALFIIVFLQVGLGYSRSFWLHVPIGVGIFGWLTRHVNRLDTPWH